MADKIERIKFIADMNQFTEALSKANVKLQEEKDKVKEITKAIKELGKESGARKDLIIEKAKAEQNIKDLKKELKEYDKTIEKTNKSSTRTFKKMAFLLTAAAGAGAGLSEIFRVLFKDSVAFQMLRKGIENFGKALGSVIDKGMRPLLKGIREVKDAELEKSFEKARKTAEKERVSFEELALSLEMLSEKTNRTAREQDEYYKLIQTANAQYPEYLGNLDAEATSHEQIVKALEQQRDLVKQQVFEEQLNIKKKELLLEEYNVRAQLNEQNKLYEEQVKRLGKSESVNEIIYQNMADIEQRRQEIRRDLIGNTKEQIKVDNEHKEILSQIIERHKENIVQVDEILAKTPQTIALKERNLEIEEKTSIALQKVIDKYENLKVIAPNTAVTIQEVWRSIFEGVSELGDLTLDEWSKTTDMMSNSANTIFSTFQNLYQADINEAQAASDKKLSILNDQYSNGFITQEDYEKKKLKLEEDIAKKTKKLKEKQRDMDAAKTTASGISAVIETFKNAGGYPWGLIPAALMTGLYLSSVNKIMSQKFQEGGLLVGASHSEGGIPGVVKGRPIEMEGGEIVTKKEVNKDPMTRDIVNYAQALKNGRLIPGARPVKGMTVYYADGTSRVLSGSGRGMPSLSSMMFQDGGSTGSINPTGSGQNIVVNAPAMKTELIPVMRGKDLFIQVTQMQNEYQRSGGELNDI